MALPIKQREELTKLRVLRHLSQPLDADSDAGLKERISTGIRYHSGLSRPQIRDQFVTFDGLLPKMQREGLIGRREEPDPRDGKSRPYFITDAGRRYLEAAQQRAMGFEPNQRTGWADEAVTSNHRAIAAVIRELPEFSGSGEARIQEVSRAVAEAVGLPAPQTGRTDAERSGR